jgi:hypothetical protein
MKLLTYLFKIIKKIFGIFKIEIMSRRSYLSLFEDLSLLQNLKTDFIEKERLLSLFSNNDNIIIFRGGDKNKYKVVCLIEFPDLWLASAGFCAIFNRALNGLYFCERFNFIPVIKGWDSCPYYDGIVNGTDNVFEYYFKRTSDINAGEVKENYFYVTATNKNMDIAWYDNNLTEWYEPPEMYISSMGEVFKKYISLNISTEKQLKNDMERVLKNRTTLGVHYRGTDAVHNANGHPVSLTYDDYKIYIDEIMTKYNYEQIFLATDDSDFISKIAADYPGMVFYEDVVRSTGNTGVHYTENARMNHKYRLGYEVIRDAYTLAECGGLIYGGSQVPILARIIKQSYGKTFSPLIFINKGINHNSRDWIPIYQQQENERQGKYVLTHPDKE